MAPRLVRMISRTCTWNGRGARGSAWKTLLLSLDTSVIPRLRHGPIDIQKREGHLSMHSMAGHMCLSRQSLRTEPSLPSGAWNLAPGHSILMAFF